VVAPLPSVLDTSHFGPPRATMTVIQKPKDSSEEQVLIEKLRKLCEPLGIHEKLVKGGEAGIDSDLTLRRWLVARKWDVDVALRDLGKHADWRVAFVPNSRIPEEEVAADLSQNKSFLQGVDKEGYAVNIVLVDRHIGTGLESTKRYITYCLDAVVKVAEEHGQSKVVGILVLDKMGYKNSDFTTLRAIFDMLQNHYVERLHKLYLYGAPTVFYALWAMVQPFIDPVTREKVQFIEKKEALEQFTKDIDADVLPKNLGGNAELKLMQDAWKELLEKEKAGVQKPEST
jgi:hypothetical protein